MTEEMIRYLSAGIGIGMIVMALLSWHSTNKLVKGIQKDMKEQIHEDYAKFTRRLGD